MYAALWRILPGPVWVRVLVVVIIVTTVLYSSATWVFPWIDSIQGASEGTVGP